MKAPIVKTFDNKKIKVLIKESSPLLQSYIKALESSLERQKEITALAIKKIKGLS